MKLNKIHDFFETVRIHFLGDLFSLLSSKNFATMAMWRNNFSPLLTTVCHKQAMVLGKQIMRV